MSEQDRIVGELLQPEGYLKLIELGLEGSANLTMCIWHMIFFSRLWLIMGAGNTHKFVGADCVEKIDAQQVFGYALFKDGKHTRLSYPLEKFHSDVAGRSFHNGRFIQRMREKAASLSKYCFFLHVAVPVCLIRN